MIHRPIAVLDLTEEDFTDENPHDTVEEIMDAVRERKAENDPGEGRSGPGNSS